MIRGVVSKMPLPNEVLTKIRSQLKKAEAQLPELEANLRDAKRAGIDVTDQVKELAELKVSIRKMRMVYG